MAVKDMAASVLARLKMQSRECGLNYQMCLQLFCQEEFLRRLAKSRYAENFVLKGGMFLYTLTQFESRPTRDIDFMIRWLSNDEGDIKKVMEEICLTDSGNEYVSMEVLGTGIITEEKEYHGVTAKFLARIKNVQIPFSIDVGVDDVIIPKAVKREICTRLEGFKKPEIYTYSLESTIAEKFDAMLKRMEATSRMKDFYDIYYLSNLFDFEGRRLQEAISTTLGHRGTAYNADSFEKTRLFVKNAFLQNLWKNYRAVFQGDCPEFEVVVDRIVAFLEPVFIHMIKEKEFFLYWSSKNHVWEEKNFL